MTEVGHDFGDVVLGVGHHPDELANDVARLLLQMAADPGTIAPEAPALVHVADEMGEPFTAELGAQNPEVREPPEDVVEDEGRHRILNRSFTVEVVPLPGRHPPRG